MGRRGRGATELQPCGTPAALRRHYKQKTPVCDLCAVVRKQMTAVDYARRTGRWAPSSGPEQRPIRNGLPVVANYVYRGLGYDVLDDVVRGPSFWRAWDDARAVSALGD